MVKKTCIESNRDVHLSVNVLKQKNSHFGVALLSMFIALIVKIRGHEMTAFDRILLIKFQIPVETTGL